MSDDQETKCIIAAFLALRNQRNGSTNSNTIREEEEKSEQKEERSISLPDAVIRDGILSYRPFRSFRVVLIRGDISSSNNTSFGGLPKKTQHEYSLTFGTNRGPLRFRVVELPYLPPHSSKSVNAQTYRGADGVVISCYMARFFEFCDRYGYNYASSSILEDVRARRQRPQENTEIELEQQHHPANAQAGRQHRETDKYPRSIVLCGNNVDITHVDARLSSIVFWQDPIPKASGNDDDDDDDDDSERKFRPPNSHIETPRHPFSSLARSLTNDNGLEFHDAACDSSSTETLGEATPSTIASESYKWSASTKLEEEWNHDDDPRNWNWLRAQVSQ